MAADLQAKGNIALAAQQYAVAKQHFDRSFQMVQSSSQSRRSRPMSARVHHFNLAAIAIEKRDWPPPKSEAEEFRKAAEASNNAIQLKLVHELAGRSALAHKDYDQAIAELEQANQQDPRNLYRQGLVYQAKGDAAKAREFFSQAAEFNSLPALPYAFIRSKAQKLAAATKLSVTIEGRVDGMVAAEAAAFQRGAKSPARRLSWYKHCMPRPAAAASAPPSSPMLPAAPIWPVAPSISGRCTCSIPAR